MYTYAFLLASALPLHLPPGIEGQLEVVVCDRLAAVVEPDISFVSSSTDDEELLQAALQHDRVMCHIFSQAQLIPLQFATCFQSRTALLNHLVKNQTEYLEKLAELANFVEYCCKLTPRSAQADTASPAVTHSLRSDGAGSQRRASDLRVAEKQSILQSIARTYPRSVVKGAQDEEIGRAYVLVPREEAFELEEQVFRWCTQLSSWSLELGNPLPPYHFV